MRAYTLLHNVKLDRLSPGRLTGQGHSPFPGYGQLRILFLWGMAHWLTTWHCPVWLVAILASCIGQGINTTITFVPVIGAMFLFLAFLEDSGYMARAAWWIAVYGVGCLLASHG